MSVCVVGVVVVGCVCAPYILDVCCVWWWWWACMCVLVVYMCVCVCAMLDVCMPYTLDVCVCVCAVVDVCVYVLCWMCHA